MILLISHIDLFFLADTSILRLSRLSLRFHQQLGAAMAALSPELLALMKIGGRL